MPALCYKQECHVMGSPGSPTARAKLTRLLTVRDLSIREARQKLKDREFGDKETEEALRWAIEYQFLNDRRLAEGLIRRGLKKSPPQGREIIRLSLQRRGIPIDICKQALETAFADLDQREDLCTYVRK